MLAQISPDHLQIFHLLKPYLDKFSNMFSSKPVFCSRIIVANLPAGKTIKKHIDPGVTFSLFHRLCWVLETNENCFMDIEGERRHFGKGEVWEIDNKSYHHAGNLGETNRIHVIFDLAPVEKLIGFVPAPYDENSYDDKLFKIVLNKKNKTGKFEI